MNYFHLFLSWRQLTTSCYYIKHSIFYGKLFSKKIVFHWEFNRRQYSKWRCNLRDKWRVWLYNGAGTVYLITARYMRKNAHRNINAGEVLFWLLHFSRLKRNWGYQKKVMVGWRCKRSEEGQEGMKELPRRTESTAWPPGSINTLFVIMNLEWDQEHGCMFLSRHFKLNGWRYREDNKLDVTRAYSTKGRRESVRRVQDDYPCWLLLKLHSLLKI